MSGSAHLLYGCKLNLRTPGIWLRVVLTVPLMEVLPYLLMGRAFLPEAELTGYLYANMLWSFVASVVLQCLVALQGLTGAGKTDLFLMADGDLVPWLSGYSASVGVLYLGSTLLACGVLGLVLGYPLSALALLALAVCSIPVTLSLVFLVFGIELRWGRTFHVINLSLDVLQVFSCVAYPLAALGALMPLAALSPVTWINEYVRGFGPTSLLWAFGISAVLLALSVAWVRRSERTWRVTGKLGV